MTDAELQEAIYLRKQGRANDACEGIYLTDEEEALFDYMEKERLSHEDCRKLVNQYIDGELDPLPWKVS